MKADLLMLVPETRPRSLSESPRSFANLGLGAPSLPQTDADVESVSGPAGNVSSEGWPVHWWWFWFWFWFWVWGWEAESEWD